MKFNKVLGCIICIIFIQAHAGTTNDNCHMSQELMEEIAAYKPTVDMILNEVISGRFKGSTYKFLADFIGNFGSRLTGSQNLENAIDYMLRLSKEHNLENVHGEEVTVPRWIRGHESAAMIEPIYQKLPILGYGRTVQTPPEGIRAEVIVVSTYGELFYQSHKIPGRIVVSNQKLSSPTYGFYKYVSSFGAVAYLSRSMSNIYLNTMIAAEFSEIPHASITVKDAGMLERRYKRGETIVIELKLNGVNLPDSRSRNTIADIKGLENPNSTVIVSGHLDSWDVGQGAIDDGAGALMSWNSLVILKALNLRPSRTLRAILWTGEEQGRFGAIAYEKTHQNDSINFILESDIGTFTPLGLQLSANTEATCIIKEILKLFASINTTSLEKVEVFSSDIDVFVDKGIPGAGLLNKNTRYFWYWHSDGDRLDVEDKDTLDLCTAFWTAVSYIISDLSMDIPRDTWDVHFIDINKKPIYKNSRKSWRFKKRQ